MTTRKIFSLLFAASFVIVSCKNELEPQESITEEPTSTIANDGESPNEPMVESGPMQVPQSTQAPTQTQSNPQTVASGMNPAHGQPGHRCEIAVGAPLSSAPATTQKTQVTPQMSTSTSSQAQITPAPTSTSTPSLLNPATSSPASGTINPAHGQPGHRCDVAVGQPLP